MTSELTDEIKTQLREKHAGKTLHVLEAEVDGQTITLVVLESPAEYEAWRDARDLEDATPKSKRGADYAFVNACRVFPSGEEFIALHRAKPGLASSFAGDLAQIMGVTRQVRRKKL